MASRQRILTIILIIIPFINQAQSRGFDEQINDAFMPFATWWEGFILSTVNIFGFGIPIVLILLLLGALFFTIYFGFVNIKHFPTAIQVVRGKYDDLESLDIETTSHVHEVEGDIIDTIKDESHHGEVNHFQALATAVSGTVGLGNIAMVAVAISIGGPGATFWMIIAGLLGMSSKFVECTLGVKYRDIDSEGNVYGGPMYYLSRGLKERRLVRLGKFLAIVFSILCIGASFGGGNAFQTNQAAAQIIERFGIEGSASGSIIGVVFAIIVGIVIIGGIKRIAKVTEKVVPLMAVLYVASALFIIFSNFSFVDDAISLIITEAFTPKATITGGFIGVMIQGFRRAAFSNEAGAGSAAIAHSAVNTKYAASEGLVGLLEPFIDTVVVCSMTAIIIVMFNMDGAFVYGDVLNGQALMADGSRLGGVNLTSMAFDNAIPGSSYVLVVAVTLFAFSTILSWSYYGLQSWKYLFGRGKWIDLSYKIIFLMFTVLGAAITLDAVIKFSDAMILALVFPNMIGLLLLFPKVRNEMKRYLKAIKMLKLKNAE
ncbi:alanine:cation symporter family protein [Flavobacteriaceae bacterium S0825]|uniref:alanine/glycine:cation symporter family protein n=1 Tax=Gaetbulibacter sp. S0825 TaxID=2720084 RepID=UPI00142F5E86|nr:alanine/glycine:cation symporter family protein [Gaetbulibacter sp. S0825]MCK0109362.1 alanine:cation symporter family protein [Flavobacteriaceae bacterium S0825]NIX64996.1 alanine:cation symporter family protein [Gaetbulibacter sp. S0825]